MAIKIIHGNAADFNFAADMIVTDPPFDMAGEKVAQIINGYQCNHLLMICSMHQLLEFVQHSDFKLNFDLVIDIVSPKQSKSLMQPNYIHCNVVYMTRNKAKSLFKRGTGQRSDVFTKGYFPTIIRASRERSQDHGHAKNAQAIQDILSHFNFNHALDPFAGSGTTGLACFELNKSCTMIELNESNVRHIKKTFKFLGVRLL